MRMFSDRVPSIRKSLKQCWNITEANDKCRKVVKKTLSAIYRETKI